VISLRQVAAPDLPRFFEHQRDPEAVALAAFSPRDRVAFDAHWTRILEDYTVSARPVLAGGEVVGNIVCFGPEAVAQPVALVKR
jgi:hypothetical protein